MGRFIDYKLTLRRILPVVSGFVPRWVDSSKVAGNLNTRRPRSCWGSLRIIFLRCNLVILLRSYLPLCLYSIDFSAMYFSLVERQNLYLVLKRRQIDILAVRANDFGGFCCMISDSDSLLSSTSYSVKLCVSSFNDCQIIPDHVCGMLDDQFFS